MDQSVMVFGGSAARSSAIGTANFEEGMVSYLTDTDKVEAYNGTDWVSVAPTTSQGLTLINTTSFSGVSSQSVNDVFSSTYDVYKVLLVVDSNTFGDGNVRMRLRVSGSDSSATQYFTQNSGFTDFNATDNFRESSSTSWFVSGTDSGGTNAQYNSRIDIFNPFKTTVTTTTGQSESQASSGAMTIFNFGQLNFDVTSWTGFTIFATSGAMTGKVLTYGYNQ